MPVCLGKSANAPVRTEPQQETFGVFQCSCDNDEVAQSSILSLIPPGNLCAGCGARIGVFHPRGLLREFQQIYGR